MKNKSHISVLNNNGPRIERWGIPDKIYCHELYVRYFSSLFTRC